MAAVSKTFDTELGTFMELMKPAGRRDRQYLPILHSRQLLSAHPA
jgi:hypothetical protein